MPEFPYLDPTAPTDERVADLLSRMTLEEKAGQLSQYFYFGAYGDAAPADIDIESLPAEHQMYARQPEMVREAVRAGGAGSLLFVMKAEMANTLQKIAVEESRLRIPLLFGFDVVHGFRTVFPVPVGLAASWDPAIIEAAQEVAAREARAAGIHWTFAPMVDIARDARWGRLIEGAGEDPFLGGIVAAAQVRGFQGDFGPENILAGPKHFAAYGAARGGRDYDDVEVSESELRNVYLPPFKAAIDAGARNIMTAYMELNGVPATGNKWLLRDILRDELGFTGFTVSDANAAKSLEAQHFAASQTDAAARALTAGLDMEMCMLHPAYANLPEAIENGQATERHLDEAVARVLAVKFELGLFERPYADEARENTILTADAHRQLSQTAAERSAVLLKNDGTLPLRPESLTRVAVIGQLANSQREVLGPWVFQHDTSEAVSIVDGLRRRLSGDVTIEHAPGAGIPGRLFPSMFDNQDPTVEVTPADWEDDLEIENAVAVASGADVAVVVVGQRQNQIGENASSSTLELPGRQLEQLQRIAETGTPIVLVVMSGRPLDLRWADQNIGAILEVWYPGTRGGDAVAALLCGDASPAGKLPFTWPRHVGQVPLVYGHMRTFQPENQDKRYWDEESTPLYPFGHGLSYSEFSYEGLTIARDRIAPGEETTVTVTVTNTGQTAADEVAQLYIHQRHGRATRPVRELKGFQRIRLEPGTSRTVAFPLGKAQLQYWSSADRDWVQDETIIDVWVGSSSTAELSGTIEVSQTKSVTEEAAAYLEDAAVTEGVS